MQLPFHEIYSYVSYSYVSAQPDTNANWEYKQVNQLTGYS